MSKGMIRIAKIPFSRVLQHIGKPRKRFWIDGKKYILRLSGERMNLLGRTQVCACCGLKGKYFWLEYSGCKPPHLNLYAVTKKGKEILMTMDHWLARSKGGITEQNNLVLLCTICNGIKKNETITLEDLRKKVEQKHIN
jgi:5-methylcytosine-specific restriction endonuclease McrA